MHRLATLALSAALCLQLGEALLLAPPLGCRCVRCGAGAADGDLSRRDLVRGASGVGLAYVWGKELGLALDWPGETFRALAKEVYAEAQAVPPARGSLRVLEVGSGKDLESVFGGRFRAGAHVTAVDVQRPDEETLTRAAERAAEDGFTFNFQVGDATALSALRDGEFDVALCSLVLCSVPSAAAAVSEIHRVLRPGGRYGFIEHVKVLEEDGRPLLALAQQVLDPVQQAAAHGCHLSRDSPATILDRFGGTPSVVRLQRMHNGDMWPISQQAAGVVVKPAR